MPSLGLKIGLGSAGTLASPASLLNGLIAWYGLNEASGNAIDANGNHDLTESGTVPSGTGLVNGARGAFSVTNYFASSNAVFDLTGTFYIGFWLNSSDVSTSQWPVTKWDLNTADRAYGFNVNSGNIDFWVSSDGTSNPGITSEMVRASTALIANTWFFVDAFYDAENDLIGVAVNGQPFTTKTWANGIHNAAADFRIGARDSTSGQAPWLGLLDEVVIYDRVPSSAERALFLTGLEYPGG